MILNTEWYRIFLHTAQSGNLTKAAQLLHITQPSVSYAIKQLEASLGVKLFDRLSKGVRLTPEGADLLQYVEQSFSLLQVGELKLKSLKDLSAGELRIGASGPIIKHLLLAPLDQLHASHPEVRIRLIQGKTAEIRKLLLEGHIDLGFVHLPFSDPDLELNQIMSIQDCFVVGPAYGLLARHPIAADEIAKIPLLLLTQGSSTRQFVEQWFSSQGIQIEADIELNSMDMLVELAGRGYGAAFVTRSFVKNELEEGKLMELSLLEPFPSRSVGLATRRGRSPSLIAKRFMEFLLYSLDDCDLH